MKSSLTKIIEDVLPVGWCSTRLGDIAFINPGLPDSTLPSDLEVSFIPMKCVSEQTGQVCLSESRTYQAVAKGYSAFIDGDIIMAKITPCMENGKVALLSNLKNGIGFGSTEFHVIRFSSKEVLNRFFFYFLMQESVRKDAKRHMTGTAGQLRVPASYLEDLVVPLPPLSEQHRIVAKIEELFSRWDAGVEALRKVQDLLKLYRTSVREAAVRGRLVPVNAEIAGENCQLVESTDKSSERNEDNSIRQFNTCSADSYDLPPGWKWATVAQLASHEANAITDGPFGSNLKTSHYTSSGPRVIRLQNIGDGTFIDEQAHISQEHYERLKKHAVKPGDIIIALLGERLPRSCVLPDGIGPAIVKADCVRFAPNRSIALPKFLNYALNSETVRKRIALIVHGVGRPRLNLKEVKSILLPLPPLAEQARIIAEVDRLFSVVDLLNTVIEQTLKNANALRNSILRLAFTGQLVPQDPTDEPASKLLERIKAERARMEADQPRKRKRRAN
ncbi:MAG: hypothetical protein GX493_02965 [Firmicutes bacterium]|nr:hypothetical protein [Bacillota bacterium]